MTPFTRQDFDSSTWQKVKEYITQRLADHQLKLENDQDETKTAKLRGRIAEVKVLLELEKTPAQGARAT